MFLSSKSVLHKLCSVSSKHHKSALTSINKGLNSQLLPTQCPNVLGCSSFQLSVQRHFSYHRISRHFEYYTADDNVTITREKDSLRLKSSVQPPEGRPLIILMSWLMSRDKHVKKFVKLYTDMGMDVLKVRTSPFDLLRPAKAPQVVAGQILEFLHKNSLQSPLVVHGFSVGAYLFGEALLKIEQDIKKHKPILDRFVGQIWDSPMDIEGVPCGISEAITDNETVKAYIKRYIEWYMEANYDTATIHYQNSSRMMHQGFLKCPSLIYVSKSDYIAPPKMASTVYEKWEKKGHLVFVKCFEESRHVSHYYKYKKEYVEEMNAFLSKIGLIEKKKIKISV